MTTVDAILIGGIIAVMACLLIAVVVWAAWQCIRLQKLLGGMSAKLECVASDLNECSVVVRSLVEECKALSAACTVIGAELIYMRSIAQGQQGIEPGQGPTVMPAANAPRPRVEFPSTIYDRFPTMQDVPDATNEDVDVEVLGQTDADLVEEELLEKLRASGINPDIEPEGIRVDSQ